MEMIIRLNPAIGDEAARDALFKGEILLYSNLPAVKALASFASECIAHAFGELDGRRAQFSISVEDFVKRLGPLKSGFTNHLGTKKLTRDIIETLGCNLDRTYFDVPRMRVVTHGGYLTAGLGY